MESWTKLSSKQILQHSRMNVFEDEVLLPNGLQTTYVHVGDVPDATIVIAIGEDGKIFVQQEYSYPLDKWLYQFPSGEMKPGENPEDCAARELAEEGSMAATLTYIGQFYIDNRRRASKFHVYIGRHPHDASALRDPEESFKDYWFTTDEITAMIRGGEITHNAFLAAWTLYTVQ